MKKFDQLNTAIEAMRAKRDAERQRADAAPELLDALVTLDKRLRSCFGYPTTAQEAYDSFYQEIVAEAIAKATGSDA